MIRTIGLLVGGAALFVLIEHAVGDQGRGHPSPDKAAREDVDNERGRSLLGRQVDAVRRHLESTR